jgi:hypothetical protein
MSPNTTSYKLLPIFTSYFWPAILALFMAFILSQWAVADPPAETDQPVAATSEEAPPTPAEKPMELSVGDESTVNTKSMPTTAEPQTTPAVSLKPMVGIEPSEKCYEQTDGSFECVCEGQEECKTLETAEYCEAGTHWGKDGYGGCTKKADE